MPTPVSREFLRGLKIKKDDEKRIEKLNTVVKNIYQGAIEVAESCKDTQYAFEIDPQRTRGRYSQASNVLHNMGFHRIHSMEYQFYKDNMEDILYSLQILFTDCNVKLANMCRGRDGRIYDISTSDSNILSLINQDLAFECILIDWS